MFRVSFPETAVRNQNEIMTVAGGLTENQNKIFVPALVVVCGNSFGPLVGTVFVVTTHLHVFGALGLRNDRIEVS